MSPPREVRNLLHLHNTTKSAHSTRMPASGGRDVRTGTGRGKGVGGCGELSETYRECKNKQKQKQTKTRAYAEDKACFY